MIIATYLHTSASRNGNSRSGWAIHQLREISDPFSNGSRVRYVGWVNAGAAGRSALKYAYPEAIEVQTIEVTPRAYGAARDAEPENDCSAHVHWHAGHNVTGYLPQDDENYAYSDWSDALSALREDLERAWDDGTDDQYLEAHTMIHHATAGQDFLAYTATHADSDHDIPTAWWVTRCTEKECAGEQS
ncbi:MAG TPA: hypothetical protein VGA04_18095 [Streptosporangiaceae bacterium]